MKMVIAITLLFTSLTAFSYNDPVRATSTVAGVVSEGGSVEKLTGVRVSVVGTDIFTYTDRDGNFELSNVPAGEVELNFSLVSFEKRSLSIAAVPGSSTEVQVELLSR